MSMEDGSGRRGRAFDDRCRSVTARFALSRSNHRPVCFGDGDEDCGDGNGDNGNDVVDVAQVGDAVLSGGNVAGEVATGAGGDDEAVVVAAIENSVAKAAKDVSVVDEAGVAAGSMLPKRERTRKVLYGGVLVSRVVVDGGARRGVAPGRSAPKGSSDKFRGKGQPVSVWSEDGEDILSDAMDKCLEVVIVRAPNQVFHGIPSRYLSYQSGFRLCIDGHLRAYKGDRARIVGGHNIEILPSDSVILSSEYSAEVAGIREEASGATGMACDCGTGDAGVDGRADSEPLDERTIDRRDWTAGRFLHGIDSLKPVNLRVRVEKMLSPRIMDVLNILKAFEPGLVRFLISALGIGSLESMSLRRIVDSLATEKSFPSDPTKYNTPDRQWEAHFDIAIEIANKVLSRSVPSAETKRKGTTVADHGVMFQIRKVKESGDRCCAFLPDLQEGNPDCRDTLFGWHSQIRDTVLPQLGVRNHKLLVDALLFQYYGVPIEQLAMFYSKGTVIDSVRVANRRLADLGVKVILNNGFAVLARVGEPAVLLASGEDAKGYTGRFSWDVSKPVDEVRVMYRDYLRGKFSRMRSVVSERTRVGVVNTAIKKFVRTNGDVRKSDSRVRALVDAFVFDRKSVEAVAESASQPDWIEIVNKETMELCGLHNLARDIGVAGAFSCRGQRDRYSYHGQLLILALVGQYHGVPRADIEKLPFSFQQNGGDSTLDVVIDRVNDTIGRDGMKIYERGGVFILGPDVSGENSDGKKVQIVGRKLPLRKYPRFYIMDLLRRAGRKGGEGIVEDGAEGDDVTLGSGTDIGGVDTEVEADAL